MTEPTPHQLSEWIVRLEGELKTSRAENETMVSQIDTRLAGMEADMAKRDADAAKRETRLILAMAVIVGVGLTIFGFLTVPPA